MTNKARREIKGNTKSSRWDIQKFIEDDFEKTISVLNEFSPATEDDVDDVQFQMAKILDLDLNGIGTSYSEEMFGNTTMMAYYDRSNDTIFVNTNYFISKDLIRFAIAHEMRHRWQYEHDEEEWFNTYKSRNKLNLKQYNEQIAEMDANAFALAAMDSLYKGWDTRLKMRWNVDVKNDIFQTDGIQSLYEKMLMQYFESETDDKNNAE